MKTYQTVYGDTWDAIAFKVFGSEYMFPVLLEYNQQYRETVIFRSGVQLQVPEMNENYRSVVPRWMLLLEDETDG